MLKQQKAKDRKERTSVKHKLGQIFKNFKGMAKSQRKNQSKKKKKKEPQIENNWGEFGLTLKKGGLQ